MGMPILHLLLAFNIYAGVAAAWTYYVVRKAQPGTPRLLRGLPVVAINLLLPALVDYKKVPLLVTPIGGLFSLAAFKVLALCIGRGPLLLPLGPLQFAAVQTLPLVPSEVFATSGGDRSMSVKDQRYLLRDYSLQMGIALGVSWMLLLPKIHGFIRHWLYTLAACSFLAAVFDMMGAGASLLLGMDIAPTFNKPWLSTSFADFWARRWNLVTTYMMRVLVYEPAMAGCLVPDEAAARRPARPALETSVLASATQPPSSQDGRPPGSQEQQGQRPSLVRRFCALQATFLVSGLWHILVFWYNTRVFSWRWCAFFAVQAPILIVERQLQKWGAGRGLALPWAVQVFVTNFLLIALANPLFFGPADDTQFATRNLEVGQRILVEIWSRMEAILPSGWTPWAAGMAVPVPLLPKTCTT